MKVRHFVIWCAVAALPQLALAAKPHAGELGALQAVFDFCSKVDPVLQAAFQMEARAEHQGLTPNQIAAIRNGSEYKRGYKLLSSALPNLSADDAKSGCVALLPSVATLPAKPGPEKRF
jgi:hypothetical protein